MGFPLRICMWRSEKKEEKKKTTTKQTPKLYQETRKTLSSALPMFDKGLTISKEQALVLQLFSLHSFYKSSLKLVTAKEPVIYGEKTDLTTAFIINSWIFLMEKSIFWGTFSSLKFPRIINIPVTNFLHC